MYDQIIEMSQNVFRDKHYEAAYHLLCAATHYAKDISNLEYLQAIHRLATEQSTWINQNAPESMLSAKSVEARHGVNLYGSLLRQLEGEMLIVKHNQKKAKL